MDIKVIAQQRFDELLAPTRWPTNVLLYRELEWYSAAKEGLFGVVVLDMTDQDFSWMILGKAKSGQYRPIRQDVCLSSQSTARSQLKAALAQAVQEHGTAAAGAGLDEAPFDAHTDSTLGELARDAGISPEEAYARMTEAIAE